ncbi:hypothetical protein THASP1DRAFT_26700, partial [Thamnocephalis sphaerospora]
MTSTRHSEAGRFLRKPKTPPEGNGGSASQGFQAAETEASDGVQPRPQQTTGGTPVTLVQSAASRRRSTPEMAPGAAQTTAQKVVERTRPLPAWCSSLERAFSTLATLYAFLTRRDDMMRPRRPAEQRRPRVPLRFDAVRAADDQENHQGRVSIQALAQLLYVAPDLISASYRSETELAAMAVAHAEGTAATTEAWVEESEAPAGKPRRRTVQTRADPYAAYSRLPAATMAETSMPTAEQHVVTSGEVPVLIVDLHDPPTSPRSACEDSTATAPALTVGAKRKRTQTERKELAMVAHATVAMAVMRQTAAFRDRLRTWIAGAPVPAAQALPTPPVTRDEENSADGEQSETTPATLPMEKVVAELLTSPFYAGQVVPNGHRTFAERAAQFARAIDAWATGQHVVIATSTSRCSHSFRV